MVFGRRDSRRLRSAYCVPEKSDHQGTHKGCLYGVWGEMGTRVWDELPDWFRFVCLDELVVVEC